MFHKIFVWPSYLILAFCFCTGCSSYQPTKNIWKSTKGLWNSYISPPATIDFEEKGALSPKALALTTSMMGIDVELARLERTMQNADRPPTRTWLTRFFEQFPWVTGFAGIKYDGTILGQEPPDSIGKIDFIPLLYEDKKQKSHALRADVQGGADGAEVIIAAPLYDGVDFLGIVAAYFDMRSLMHFSSTPEDLVILCPYALLWPGKYDFSATPLAGINWGEAAEKSTGGTCTNANGTFFYQIRYLGNLPIVFAVAETGDFPEGSGHLDQGIPFFPQEREKLPPPNFENKKADDANRIPSFREPDENSDTNLTEGEAAEPKNTHKLDSKEAEIQPGSNDSVLLRKKNAHKQKRVQERRLEGENITVERVKERRARKKSEHQEKRLELIPNADMPTLSGGRPSPFGPRTTKNEENIESQGLPASQDASHEIGPPSDFRDSHEKEESTKRPAVKISDDPDLKNNDGNAQNMPSKDHSESGKRAILPGGRPSPFGPR